MALKTVEDFVTAYHHADCRWEELDKPLIRFFAENPRHEDVKIVFGNITLVNRTYNTNLHMAGDEAEGTVIVTPDRHIAEYSGVQVCW
jgi:hypothetical protein